MKLRHCQDLAPCPGHILGTLIELVPLRAQNAFIVALILFTNGKFTNYLKPNMTLIRMQLKDQILPIC